MKQWEKRVISFEIIYSLLIREDIDSKIDLDTNNISEEVLSVVNYYINNKDDIKSMIIPYIKEGWSWERLYLIDKAILCNAICEKKVIGTEKNVIIDQSIITAKNFSDKNSYKFINSILDKVL